MDLTRDWPPDFRGWIPGFSGFGVVLAREPKAVLTLTCPAAYPDALCLDLNLRLVPQPTGATFGNRFGPQPSDWLRLSLKWPDGEVTNWTTVWDPPEPPSASTYKLDAMGSVGGHDGIWWNLVLRPLPRVETAVVTVTGDDFGRAHTSTIDLRDPIAAAARAERWAD